MTPWSSAGSPTARFDDLVAGHSFTLVDHVESRMARRIDEVRSVITWAQASAAAGRWVAGYVSYEAAPAFDGALSVRPADMTPLAWFSTFERSIDPDDDPDTDEIGAHHVSRWEPLVDRQGYEEAFANVRARIRSGDTYQVNLTFPLRASFSGDPRSLYRALVKAQNAPYASYLRHDDIHVVSVSPERFFAIDGSGIVTTPMKGTRPRGRWLAEDVINRDDLATSGKDQAENVMIVDLIRNDLGRIAQFGSVAVDELFTVEAYPTVWQMTSKVSAQLESGVTLEDVFAALFPCGSVTGAPKPSTMRIIADVERHPRGIYCGAIGFIPPGDGLDGASFSVAIRTAVVDQSEGIVTYGVGGGVTWGSVAEGEYAEALAKSRVLVPRDEVPGLFETIRWDDGWVWLEEHLARLEASSHHLGIPFSRDRVGDALADAEGRCSGPSRVRLVLDRSGDFGVTISEAPGTFATRPGPHAEVTIVGVDLDPVDAGDERLFHKTTDRTRYDERARRHGDRDDVLLTNTDGFVTESTIANVVFLIDGEWVTPPVHDGLLPGILRARLIEEGTITERSVTVPEAHAAEAVALINSVRGWRNATLAGVGEARRRGVR
ncbi:MAG TPA: aminodeoxychorismate synthase component I [Acidimicrobiia bacterium]|nr:aminodeoxychorismate synthase component I [Acidimicrobiia bacterium]